MAGPAIVRALVPPAPTLTVPAKGAPAADLEARVRALESELAGLRDLMYLATLSHKDTPVSSVPKVMTGTALGTVAGDYKLLWRNNTGRLVKVAVFCEFVSNGIRVRLSRDASDHNKLDELSNSGANGPEPGKIHSEPILLKANEGLYIALVDDQFPGVAADKIHVRLFDPGAHL